QCDHGQQAGVRARNEHFVEGLDSFFDLDPMPLSKFGPFATAFEKGDLTMLTGNGDICGCRRTIARSLLPPVVLM
ncbi:MAG TPA: hypothetical protein VGE93_26350, partial [Bryobacteraceae bacterium]